MYNVFEREMAELEGRLDTEIRLRRNPIVAANNKSMPKIYGSHRKNKKQVKSRVYERLRTQNTSVLSQEILEVVRMRAYPTTRQSLQKQVLSIKNFTLEELADRVHTPKSRTSSRVDSPINRLKQAYAPAQSASKASSKNITRTLVYPRHIVLDRLREVSPLPHENETEHKVIRRYLTNVILPPITSETEPLATATEQYQPQYYQDESGNSHPSEETNSPIKIRDNSNRRKRNWSEQSKKMRLNQRYSFFIEEEPESNASSSADEPSPSRRRRNQNRSSDVLFEKKITISDPRVMKEASTGMEKVSMELREFSGNTYFFEMTKKYPLERMKHSRTKSLIASQASSLRFGVPAKEEISELLEHYEPMDLGFDIKYLLSSSRFHVVIKKGFVYAGEIEEGKPHGLGLLFSEKARFEGYFVKGEKYRGTEINSEGKYSGSYCNGLREGNGNFTWNNKYTYSGYWKIGMKNGVGKWTSPNGDYYQGTWVNNKQEGEGIHFHKGNTYQGQFSNFKKHGKGIEQLENGDRYYGEYSDGKPNGIGDYIWADGSKYTGEFYNGMRHGLGVLERYGNLYRGTGSGYVRCVGSFKHDFKDGEGYIFYKDGSSFKGVFHEDRPTANGEYKCADGSPALFDVSA